MMGSKVFVISGPPVRVGSVVVVRTTRGVQSTLWVVVVAIIILYFEGGE